MQYDNTNRGSIWANEDKKQPGKENHPDFKGSLDIDGKEYWVSAWKRKPDANPKAPSLSFSVKAKDEQAPQQQAVQQAPQQQVSDFDMDTIPF